MAILLQSIQCDSVHCAICIHCIQMQMYAEDERQAPLKCIQKCFQFNRTSYIQNLCKYIMESFKNIFYAALYAEKPNLTFVCFKCVVRWSRHTILISSLPVAHNYSHFVYARNDANNRNDLEIITTSRMKVHSRATSERATPSFAENSALNFSQLLEANSCVSFYAWNFYD